MNLLSDKRTGTPELFANMYFQEVDLQNQDITFDLANIMRLDKYMSNMSTELLQASQYILLVISSVNLLREI